MSKHLKLLAGASAIALFAIAGAANADPDKPKPSDAEVVVTADRAGLLERRPNDTVMGLNKPLLETPRSASFVSDITLERYGIQTIDKLTEVSPGTYTASYYGVPGSLNIRGTLAENYFKGFKRIEDRGTYSTPIGDAEEIQIVRGPPSPIYGPGKVGGMLNFIPKSASIDGHYLTTPTAEVTATLGSYDKKNVTGQFGAPVKLGIFDGGIYAYGEVEDSKSYYEGINPKRQLGEISASFDVGSGWSTNFDTMLYHSTGDVQTPGWNRLTQSLIDNRTYTTGHNTVLVDSNHNGVLDPTEVSVGGFYPFTTSLYTAYFGFPPATDPRFVLNAGVGTTTLSPRNVFISPVDFSNTGTATFYYDLVKDFGNGDKLKLQLFSDDLSNKRFVSYGFPADYHAWTYEGRLTYNFDLSAAGGLITAKSFVGTNYRAYEGRQKETYDSGLIALDRRDLSVGATPTDTFASPFNGGSLGWETNIHSHWTDAGLFATTDIAIQNLDIILGGRYDDYTAASQDTGIFAFCGHCAAAAGKTRWTYQASATYKLPWGIMPYITYDQSAAMEIEQAGDLKPDNVFGGNFLSDSSLAEVGVKFQLLDKTLVGSVAAYRQKRTQLSGLNGVTQPTVGQGVEYEFRYLATSNLSFTLVGNFQHTEIIGPDHSVVYIPVYTAGVSGVNGYGGAFLTFDFSQWGGVPGNYADTLIPDAVASLNATYTSNTYAWGQLGGTLGATYAGQTGVLVPNGVHYPAYTVANLSLFYKRGPYDAILNVTNLFDKLYFTPDQDTYANVGALPSKGREIWLTVKRKF
jgi:iron complex outermembrane receptor protein